MDRLPQPDEWFARLTDTTRQRLIDDPLEPVPRDLESEVALGYTPPVWNAMRIPKRRPPFMLAFEYEQYMKLTALYVQYVRAMERRQADRDEIRAPKHRLAADTMANLRAVDRDPSVTWSEYEDWLTKLPPGRIR